MQIQQQLKGIKTDLFAIERYVDEIVEQIKCKPSAKLPNLCSESSSVPGDPYQATDQGAHRSAQAAA